MCACQGVRCCAQVRLEARVAYTACKGPALQLHALAATRVAAEGTARAAVVSPREESEADLADGARDREVGWRPLGGGRSRRVLDSPLVTWPLARRGGGAVRARANGGGAVVLRA